MEKGTVLITGASGGLGKDVVTYLHEQGFQILAVVGSDKHLNLFDQLPNVQTKAVDVLDENRVAEFLHENQSIKLQAAILLVGGFAMGSIQETNSESIQKMFGVNFFSAFNVVKPLMDRFAQQGGGQFILIGARPALDPGAGQHMVAYALSKSLVFNLAELINAQGKAHTITATVITPSIIDTPTNRDDMPDADTSSWVTPANIAELIAFTLNNTGQMLRETVIKLYNRA